MKNYLRNSAIIALGWLAFLLSMFLQGAVRELGVFLMLLLVPGAFLVSVALLATYLSTKLPLGYPVSFGSLLALVGLDHGIKLVIFLIGVDKINYQIVPNLIYLQPKYNLYGSYLGSLFSIKFSNLSYIVLYIIVGFLLVEGYNFYVTRNNETFWSSSFYLMVLAGIVASGFDKVFWGKTLDTLYIKPLFVCDLKDFYITFALFFIAVQVFKEESTPKKTTLKDDIQVLKEFGGFVMRRYQSKLKQG